MDKQQNNSGTDASIFLVAIVAVIGLVGYKFIKEISMDTIIIYAINITLCAIGVALFILLVIFSFRDFLKHKSSIFSNVHVRIFTIIIGIICVIIPSYNINYLHINAFSSLRSIMLILLSIIIVLITYYTILDYYEQKRLYLTYVEQYLHKSYHESYEVADAISDLRSFMENNPVVEKLYHDKIIEVSSYMELLKKDVLIEYQKREKRVVAYVKIETEREHMKRESIEKLLQYFKERKASEAIPEWALNINRETITEAVKAYEDYEDEEYANKLLWERVVRFMLEYKGLPNNYQELKTPEQQIYMKAYLLMKEHKLEKESEERPQVLSEDRDLVKKYFYQADELTAEQRHRFIHNYGYRIKPFIFAQNGKRGNNVIIKNDPRKESDYHFCTKYLLANVHKKNSYVEYPIEQQRTDIMINVNGNLFAFEIETGDNKPLQIERKLDWLDRHFDYWYIVCSRNNKKRYKKYVDKRNNDVLTITEAYKKILEINHLKGVGT